MKINVLIATHARSPLLRRTLESVAGGRLPPGLDRILVIENGHERGDAEAHCREFAAKLPLDYHHRAETGKSRALQWAIEKIGDGLIVFFDDDIRIEPNLFEEYAAAAQRYGEGYFFGGPIACDFEERPPTWLNEFLPASAVGWELPAGADFTAPRTFFGMNYAAYAKDVLRVGGFNPNLGPGAVKTGTEGNPVGQEVEMQERLLAAGVRSIYLPHALAYHYVPHDRCSQAWALHRKYREAITEALRDPAKTASGPELFGAPRWQWRLYLRTRFAAGAALLKPDPRARFEARAELERIRGWMEATRLKRRHAGVAVKPKPAE